MDKAETTQFPEVLNYIAKLEDALRLIKETAINRGSRVAAASSMGHNPTDMAVQGFWTIRDVAAQALGEIDGNSKAQGNTS